MVKDDSILAQKIVGLIYNNYTNELFNNHSQIYIKSNEKINYYSKYFKDKKSALSVISCGDQIINMINNGITKIDAFDISVFPKYYLKLKLAALKVLNKDEYINMFYDIPYNSDLYDFLYFFKIRTLLDKDTQEFWDSLINFYDWNDITSSPLFSSETVSVSDVINQNEYLKDEYYESLKDKIDKVTINTYDGNIIDLVDTLKHNKYDLAYLSNIIYYVPLDKYKSIISNINLNSKGILISYVYESLNQLYNYFKNDDIYKDEINSNCGLLLKRSGM